MDAQSMGPSCPSTTSSSYFSPSHRLCHQCQFSQPPCSLVHLCFHGCGDIDVLHYFLGLHCS
uniref:Uncharacterized protein n=1 Tax=Lotus japonicus TaxID=34305 RepID=I3S3P9_LOTJA|nr:unknown [Lotus japonicus]